MTTKEFPPNEVDSVQLRVLTPHGHLWGTILDHLHLAELDRHHLATGEAFESHGWPGEPKSGQVVSSCRLWFVVDIEVCKHICHSHMCEGKI